MSVFYDPKQKKPKSWVIVLFFIIPVVMFVLLFVLSRPKVERNKLKQQTEQEQDIFDKI